MSKNRGFDQRKPAALVFVKGTIDYPYHDEHKATIRSIKGRHGDICAES